MYKQLILLVFLIQIINVTDSSTLQRSPISDTEAALDIPTSRFGHSMVVVSNVTFGEPNMVVIYGGISPNSKEDTNNIFNCKITHDNYDTLQCSSWNSNDEATNWPPARAYHQASLLPGCDLHHCKMVIFGGMKIDKDTLSTSNGCALNDMWLIHMTFYESNYSYYNWTLLKGDPNKCSKSGDDKSSSSDNKVTPVLWVFFSIGVLGVIAVIAVYVFKEIKNWRQQHYSGVIRGSG